LIGDLWPRKRSHFIATGCSEKIVEFGERISIAFQD
jgi:hypothetical protein